MAHYAEDTSLITDAYPKFIDGIPLTLDLYQTFLEDMIDINDMFQRKLFNSFLFLNEKSDTKNGECLI